MQHQQDASATMPPQAPATEPLRPLTSVQVVVRASGGASGDRAAARRRSDQRVSRRRTPAVLEPRTRVRSRPPVASPSPRCACQGLVSAVKHDNLAMVEWLHEHCPRVLPYAAMIEAAKTGNVRLLEWLSERHERPQWPPANGAFSRVGGHPKNSGDVGFAIFYTIGGGHLDTVKWIYASCKVRKWNPVGNADSAVKHGHFEVAKFFLGQPRQFAVDPTRSICSAAEMGDLELTKSLYSKLTTPANFDRSYKPIDLVSRRGHLHVVQWLHDHLPGGCSRYAIQYAAKSGSLELVQWLQENRLEVRVEDSAVMDSAATEGHLHIVKWLHENRPDRCSYLAMDLAARNGHCAVVKWLHENRTEGCTYEAMDGAASSGHLHIVKWLHANRTEGCTTGAMDGAAMNGHLEVAQWLYEHRTEGCTARAMYLAAGYGRLDVVKWLHENRSDGCMSGAVELAATNGHFEVLLFLHANRSERCTLFGVQDGRQFIKYMEILQWLQANYPDLVIMDSLRAQDGYISRVLEHVLL